MRRLTRTFSKYSDTTRSSGAAFNFSRRFPEYKSQTSRIFQQQLEGTTSDGSESLRLSTEGSAGHGRDITDYDVAASALLAERTWPSCKRKNKARQEPRSQPCLRFSTTKLPTNESGSRTYPQGDLFSRPSFMNRISTSLIRSRARTDRVTYM